MGLLEAVEIAREEGDARAMVIAAEELDRILGYLPPAGQMDRPGEGAEAA